MEMPEQAYAEIQAGNERVRLTASSASSLLLCTVDGWYGTPQTKVQLSERTMGHGAYVPAEPILYAARTVTLGVVADAQTNAEVAAVMDSLSAFAGKMCRIAISDSGAPETEAHGYVEVEWDRGPYMTACKGTVTIVCPDPRRYSTQAQTAYMNPAASSDSGLLYSGSGTLMLPLAYSGKTETGSGTATVANRGTATAYPIITCYGSMGHISIRSTTGTGTLSYNGWAGPNAPVVLDCLSRTATVNGVDVTRNLVQRTWPSIPAGGSITLSCTAKTSGSAYIKVESHDTYI